MFRPPFGSGRHAPVAGVDQAYVIAAILENPEPHDRQAYPLHGPVEMGYHGIAQAVSRALRIPVSYEPISVEEFAGGLASLGKSPHLIQALSNVAIDYQNGVFQGTNNLIEVIGNRSPMTVEEFVIDRKQRLQPERSEFRAPEAQPDKLHRRSACRCEYFGRRAEEMKTTPAGRPAHEVDFSMVEGDMVGKRGRGRSGPVRRAARVLRRRRPEQG